MIEIDDAGAGSYYGGIIIFITDGSNNYWEEIDIKYFHNLDKKPRNKEIAIEVGKILERGFKQLNIKRTDKISICQGAYLKGGRDYLRAKSYNYKEEKIIGRTQALVEQLFGNLLSQKYDIKEYYPNNHFKNNSLQMAILKKRRDFAKVKQFWNPVQELMKEAFENNRNSS